MSSIPTSSNKARVKTGRVTQRDIADAVGVSHVAVSHVLHQPHRARISPETRNEILRVARQMGYEPRSATTHTIGLVVDPASLWADVTTNVFTAADEVLREYGYRMSVSTLTENTIHHAPRLFNQKTVDGVIFAEWYENRSKSLYSLKVPWILVADTVGLSNVDVVGMDTVQTARTVTEYLIKEGHRYFCLVTGAAGVGMHERSVEGARLALKQAGLPVANLSILYDASGQSLDLEEKLLAELARKQPPTAIVAGAPGSAMTVLNRLQRNGCRVPEDVSLVSLIDSPRLPALRPSISATTALDRDTVRLAIERILQRVKEPNIPPEQMGIGGEIIARGSVKSLA